LLQLKREPFLGKQKKSTNKMLIRFHSGMIDQNYLVLQLRERLPHPPMLSFKTTRCFTFHSLCRQLGSLLSIVVGLFINYKLNIMENYFEELQALDIKYVEKQPSHKQRDENNQWLLALLKLSKSVGANPKQVTEQMDKHL
jgi:hypothetical protein